MSKRSHSWQAAAVAVAMVLAAMAANAAPASAEPGDEELPTIPCPSFSGPPAAEDEFTAYQYARACNVDVEVMSLRDIDRQVFATPGGLMDAKVAVEPYWVKNSSGAWVDIDPAFAAQPDGSAAARATVIGVRVGAAGQNVFVTAADPDHGSLSLTWPLGPLPAPVLSGSVATYPEVRPGVDLAVQAEPVGFSWVLVVKTEEAKDDPVLAEITIGFQADGLSAVEDPETGRVEVVNGAGEVVFEAGQGIMWDSVPPAGTARSATIASAVTDEPGRIGDVAVDLTGSSLKLKPDLKMLAGELNLPVYIDPPFTSTRKAWANVYANAAGKGWTGDTRWPRSGGMRIGLNTWSDCGDGCGLWRSAITLNVGKLKGKYLNSAVVKALQTHTGGCGSYGLQLWRTKQISNGVSWNGITWLYGGQLQTRDVPSSNRAGGCSGTKNEWVSFDGANVLKRVKSAADEGNDTISFGLRSSSEGDRNAWRRIDAKSVRLEVTYYIYPPKPDRLALDGDGCVTNQAGARWVMSRTPVISLRAKSYESESVYVRMRVRKLGTDTDLYAYRTPDPVGSYSTVNRTVTTSLADGAYTWSARSESRQSAAVNSGYTDPCYFKVDATKPTAPSLTAPGGPFAEGQNVTITAASTDPVVNGIASGVDRFEYSWNSPVYDKTTSGSVTLTAPAAGRHVLYIRAADKAGNLSAQRIHTFFVGQVVPPTEMGMWRFEGEVYDDSGHDRTLTKAVGTGPAYAPDSAARPAAALELDGATCFTGKPPVATDRAFSLSVRVRLDTAPATKAVVVAQSGADRTAFQVDYETADNTWNFWVARSATTNHVAYLPNPVPLGQWVQLEMAYDPDSATIRIAVNGEHSFRKLALLPSWNSSNAFSVGCLRDAAGTAGSYFDGAIDDLGIWQGRHVFAFGEVADLPAAAELARWEFRNGGTDSSRYGRTLAIPATVTAGYDRYNRPNGAAEFDGQSCLDHANVTVPTDRSWSVGTWVKATANHRQTLISTLNDAGNAGIELQKLPLGPANYQFMVRYFSSTGTPYGAYFGDVAPGGWHHVAVGFDAVAKKMTLYLDGVSVRSFTSTVGAPQPSSGVLIGCGKQVSGGQTVRGNYLAGSLQDVRLWRGPIDANDLTAMMGYPPPDLSGRWRLEGGAGADTSGRVHDLALEGQTQPTDGYACDPDSAVELTGSGSARTAGPVIATDDSFTVSAWARLSALDTDVTVVSAAGQLSTSFRLRYSASQQRFGFLMMQTDTADSTWLTLYGGTAPAVDTWYHLVGVYDLAAGQMRFYISGQPVGTKAGPASPWNATGPLVVGASATAGGARWQRLSGAVDDIAVWQGVLPDHVIGQISAAPIGKC